MQITRHPYKTFLIKSIKSRQTKKNSPTVFSLSAIFVCLLSFFITACSEEPKTSATEKQEEEKKPITTTVASKGYDFDLWAKKPISVSGTNASDIFHLLNKPISQIKTLDFYGNTATKHNYFDKSVEFFDIIDSKELIELNWFLASEDDGNALKLASKKIAEMAHKSARIVLKEDGATIVKQMVTRPNISATPTNKRIKYAKCEVFFCRLVIAKSGQVSANDATTQ